MAVPGRAGGRCDRGPARGGVRPERRLYSLRCFTNYGTDPTQEYVRAARRRGIAHLLVGSKASPPRRSGIAAKCAARHRVAGRRAPRIRGIARAVLFAVLDDTLFRFKNAHGRSPSDYGTARKRSIPEFVPIPGGPSWCRGNRKSIAQLPADRGHHPRAVGGDTGARRLRLPQRRRACIGQCRTALTDLARSFEVAGGATSFRAFVEYLETRVQRHDQRSSGAEQEGRRRAI